MQIEFPHTKSVQGWVENQAILFTSFYNAVFLHETNFNSLEIGVHHGKFFIALENITPIGSKAIAIDIFDSQEKNIDKSGQGDLEIFKRNVAEFCLEPKRVLEISIDSLDLDISEIGINQFGLLSIDGGHTANHTMKDLQTCESLINENGLIILDDILNPAWTGVVTGAVQYFLSNTGKRIAPFAIGYNKLFCCHFTRKEAVQKKVIEKRKELKSHGIEVKKYTEFAGTKILFLGR